MNAIQRSVGFLAKRALKYAGIPLRDPALSEMFGVSPTAAGLHVDEHNATSLSSYFSGVQLIASSIARINFELCKLQKSKGVEINDEHDINRLLRIKPNKNMTPYSMIEMVTFQAISWGNGYLWIERNQDRTTSLWPLPASQVTPAYNKQGDHIYNYRKRYEGEQDRVYQADEIIHIPGYMFDGLRGYSVVNFARQSLGLSMAMEAFGASYFGNNAVPGGVIEHPGDLDTKAKLRLEKDINDKIQGPLRARRLLILDENMKYHAIGIPPEDSQFLESRLFQVKEICRWLRIPPHMLFEVNASTIGSIEEQGLDFSSHTLGPWQDKWCQEFKIKLLNVREQQAHFFRPTGNGQMMLNTDTAKRFENYAKGRNSLSIYTINDLLRLEGRPTMDDPIADVLIAPSTMKILGASDPSTPILPAVIDATLALIANFDPAPDEVTVKNILLATMPSASEDLIKNLLVTIKKSDYAKPEPKGMISA